jgi:hypothetical protein
MLRSCEALAPNCFKSFRREVDLQTVWSGTSAGQNAYVSGMWHAHLNHQRAGAQNLERRRALLVDPPEATRHAPHRQRLAELLLSAARAGA